MMRTLGRLLLTLLVLSVVTDMPIPDGFKASVLEATLAATTL